MLRRRRPNPSRFSADARSQVDPPELTFDRLHFYLRRCSNRSDTIHTDKWIILWDRESARLMDAPHLNINISLMMLAAEFAATVARRAGIKHGPS